MSAESRARSAVAAPVGEFGVYDTLADVAHGYYIEGFSDLAVQACRAWLRLTLAAGDPVTSRYLWYIEASAHQEVGRHAEAVSVSQELLRSLGDDLEPMWRAKALSVLAEASASLGEHARAIAALAEADWLLRAIDVRTYGHLSASMAVSLALQSMNLLEQSEAALSAIRPGHGPEIDGIVVQGLALLSAYWGTSLVLVGRPSEAVAHFAAAASRARRVHRLAEMAGKEQRIARAAVLEAYALMCLGEPELAVSRVRSVQGTFRARPELHETQLMHLVLARAATVAGSYDEARGHLRTVVADADWAGREMWSATGTAALAGVYEAEHGPNDGMSLWRDVAGAALAKVWSERGARFAALQDRDHLRELALETTRMGSAVLEDPLTGLGNRRRLDEALERGTGGRSAVFVDVDQFKAVNDDHSHAVGDQVLREIGQILQWGSRPADLVIRYGGDEFLVLPDGGPAVALRVAERVLRAVAERPWSEIAAGLEVTVSIGVAHATGPDGDTLAAADAALRTAKRAGRNRIRIA